MKFIENVKKIHQVIISNESKMNMPIIIPETFSTVENTPHINKLLVSLAA